MGQYKKTSRYGDHTPLFNHSPSFFHGYFTPFYDFSVVCWWGRIGWIDCIYKITTHGGGGDKKKRKLLKSNKREVWIRICYESYSRLMVGPGKDKWGTWKNIIILQTWQMFRSTELWISRLIRSIFPHIRIDLCRFNVGDDVTSSILPCFGGHLEMVQKWVRVR